MACGALRGTAPGKHRAGTVGRERLPGRWVHFCLNLRTGLKAFIRMSMSPPVTAASKSGDQAEFVRECTEFFAEVVQFMGVPKSVGQIYGILYATPAPLSFSDIVERLEISKGSASQGLQFLRSLGAVHQLPPGKVAPATGGQPAARAQMREYYEPELSLRKLVSGILREKVAPLATSGSRQMTRIKELAEACDRNQRSFYMGRANQLLTWRNRIKTVLPILYAMIEPPR